MFNDHIVKVHTICMGRWRIAEEKGIALIDITFKSASDLHKKLFAPPTFNLIMDYKIGRITKCQYDEAYLNKLTSSSKLYYQEWMDFLLSHDEIALACYCGNDDKCHRKLLAEFLVKFGEENDIDVINQGELTYES